MLLNKLECLNVGSVFAGLLAHKQIPARISLPRTNTLAYFAPPSMTEKKSFMTLTTGGVFPQRQLATATGRCYRKTAPKQSQGPNVINLFTVVIYKCS